MNYLEKTFAASHPEVHALLLSAFLLTVTTTAAEAGLGPIFPLDGGTQLATRPDGTTIIVETYNECVEPAHVLYREVRVGKIDFGATNQSSFQVRADVTSPGCRFGVYNPAITVNSTNAVIAYTDKSVVIFGEPHAYDIAYSMLDSNNAPTAPFFAATDSNFTATRSWQDEAVQSRIAMNRSGELAIVWFYETENNDSYAHARLFDSGGQPLGTNSFFTLNQGHNAYASVVGIAEDGSSVYAWEDAEVQKYGFVAGRDVYGRLADSNGVPVGAEFQVNNSINSTHNDAEIAVAGNGSFVIVWTQSNSDADGVYLQRFDAAANRLGEELRASPYNGMDPQVAMTPDGRFIVVWQGQDGDGSGIFAQRFLVDGSFYGNTLWVNEGATNSQTKPLLGMADDGTFIVKWIEGTNNRARWVSWDATNQTQILGPRIQSMSPASPVAAPITNVTVTFDRVMNAATFVTTNGQLIDPVGRTVPITLVQTTNNQIFTLGFAAQHLPGRYQVRVGPNVQDANGVTMDENGNTIKGEAVDVFLGQFTLTSSETAAFPITEGFESGPDALIGWSFVSYGSGTISVVSTNTPHGGTNHLFFDTPPRNGSSQSATLAIDLSGQVGQTNLWLTFWAKYYLPFAGNFGSSQFLLELSDDGETWHPVFQSGEDRNGGVMFQSYTEYFIDLDQAALANGISLDGDVYVRFRHVSTDSYSANINKLFIDDVTVQAGNSPGGPKVLGHSPNQWAGTNLSLNIFNVAFDKAIDPATFTGADVVLFDPWQSATIPVVVTPVGGSGNTQFNLAFSNQQVRGEYKLTVGPNIADSNGRLMNQNGNAANGEPGIYSDSYIGVVTFLPSTAQARAGPILFEETFENWPPAPAYWSFIAPPGGGIELPTYRPPHRGTNQLGIQPYYFGSGRTNYGATLVLDLSAWAGQTNLFLEFWAGASYTGNGSVSVLLSGDGQMWWQILSGTFPTAYTRFVVDLDGAAALNAIQLDQDVYLRFLTPGTDHLNLDDVRILAGNPDAPILSSLSRAGSGQFQFEITGPEGSNCVIYASTNLSAWIPIATNLIPASGFIPITDASATNYNQRFYRALLP